MSVPADDPWFKLWGMLSLLLAATMLCAEGADAVVPEPPTEKHDED